MKTRIILNVVLTLLMVGFVGASIFSMIGLSADLGCGLFMAASIILGLLNAETKNMAFSTLVPPATNVDAIAKWAGMYSKQMFAQVINGLDVFADLSVDRNVSRFGKLLPKFKAEKGLRPLDTSIDNNGQNQRSIGGRKLMVYDSMKIFNIVVDDLITSFLSDMMVPGAKEIPFAQWFWQKEFEKLGSEINDNFSSAEYAGNAAAFDSGAVYTFSASVSTFVKFGTLNDIYKLVSTTTAGQSPTTHPAKWTKVNEKVTHTGHLTIIKNEITGGAHTNVITTGTVTNANALEKVELIYNSMTVAHRNAGGKVWLSPTDYTAYMQNYRTVYPYSMNDMSGDGAKYIFASGKKWEVKQATWLGTSRRIIFDLQMNLRVGTNLVTNPGITNIVPTLHGYDAVSKFFLGAEICDLETLYTSEQA